ncbi:MAG: hypothetical protein ACREX3_13885 [Gammaproteobacteria bacterium]
MTGFVYLGFLVGAALAISVAIEWLRRRGKPAPLDAALDEILNQVRWSGSVWEAGVRYGVDASMVEIPTEMLAKIHKILEEEIAPMSKELREIRRHQQTSFWKDVGLDMLFFLLGAGASFLLGS